MLQQGAARWAARCCLRGLPAVRPRAGIGGDPDKVAVGVLRRGMMARCTQKQVGVDHHCLLGRHTPRADLRRSAGARRSLAHDALAGGEARSAACAAASRAMGTRSGEHDT